MLAKAIGTWFAVAALLLGASPAYGDTSAEIATRLAHARAALTATRGQLTLEQWALLSGKLAVRSMPWRTTTNSSRGQDGHWPLLNQWMTTPAAR